MKEETKESYREKNFQLKVSASKVQKGEIEITHTHNGYQWYTFAFTKNEAMQLIKKIKEFYKNEA